MRDLLAYLSRLTRDSKSTAEIAQAPAAGGGLSFEQFEQVVHPKPGDWPTYHGNIGGNRHSPLSEINTSNVASLAAKWLFPIAGGQRLEVTPLVVDGVMYVTMANEAYAVDAKNGREIGTIRVPSRRRCGRRGVENQPRRGGAGRQSFHAHR
jgi:glucose dehydrogenase